MNSRLISLAMIARQRRRDQEVQRVLVAAGAADRPARVARSAADLCEQALFGGQARRCASSCCTVAHSWQDNTDTAIAAQEQAYVLRREHGETVEAAPMASSPRTYGAMRWVRHHSQRLPLQRPHRLDARGPRGRQRDRWRRSAYEILPGHDASVVGDERCDMFRVEVARGETVHHGWSRRDSVPEAPPVPIRRPVLARQAPPVVPPGSGEGR